MKICLINGPNLNWLGKREVDLYGEKTLNELNKELLKKAKKNKIELIFFQSNSEGEIIDFIYEKSTKVFGFIINPGALSHYSYSLRDCIASVKNIFIEVHISNIENREKFREKSIITPVVNGKIFGLGNISYILALEYFVLKFINND